MTDSTTDGDRRTHLSRALPIDRFNAFSDGVFAIAITLLVLELPVPTGEDLLASLVEEWPEFLGYFISFAFIGMSWMTHARVTGFMKGGDTAAGGLNLLALLFIALLPFATSLMVSNIGGPDERVAVLIYGINVLVASVMLTLLMAYLVRKPDAVAGRNRRRDAGGADSAAQDLQRGLAHRGRLRPGHAAGRDRSLRAGYHPHAGLAIHPVAPHLRIHAYDCRTLVPQHPGRARERLRRPPAPAPHAPDPDRLQLGGPAHRAGPMPAVGRGPRPGHLDIPTPAHPPAAPGSLERWPRQPGPDLGVQCDRRHRSGNHRVVVTCRGGPELLQVIEVDLPAPAPDEVRIQVEATGDSGYGLVPVSRRPGNGSSRPISMAPSMASLRFDTPSFP